MSTKATKISILEDLKRTGQMPLFNPHKYFVKSELGIEAEIEEWTAEVFLEGDSPRYTFLAPGENKFYDGHLYLDRLATGYDTDGFTLFTFVDGVYQEITFVEHPFNPYKTVGPWENMVKEEILKFL